MRFVMGIESTAHTFGIGLVSLDEKIIVDFSDSYVPERGGIHPREAAEHHAKIAPNLLGRALRYLRNNRGELAAIGFSRGPGLGPCLRVGATFARSLAAYLDVPLYGVHHAIAHIELGKKLTGLKNPLAILVSGGHTIIVSKEKERYRVWGETLDITLGNLIDMFMMFAGYTALAGSKCEELARKAEDIYEIPYVVKGTDLSFSGILSALKRAFRMGVPLEVCCKSLQETAFAILCEVTERALVHSKKKEILLCGGVANNRRLQDMMMEVAKEHGAKFAVPSKWNGDNGAMIAYLTLLYYESGAHPLELGESYVLPLWRLDRIELPY